MTFNRKTQFSILDKIYNSADNGVVVFYSEYESDLHSVIDEFLKDKDYFYYKAVQVTSDEQIKIFVDSINEQLPKHNISDLSYAQALNEMLNVKCEKRVIVIDEFQNIIKYSNELISEMLKSVNNKWGNQPVLFLMLSTNAYFVEKQMVSKLEEMAYEISGVYKLADLTFVDVMQQFEKYSKKDLVLTYAITGGKYRVINKFDPALSLKDNIVKQIVSKDGELYKAGFNILPPELREHSVYNTILVNLAKGMTKLNDLHKATGFSRAKISVYLNNLIEHNLIEKIDSIDSEGRDNTVKGIYSIKDSFLLFFYRFIYTNSSLLEVTDPERFYKKYVLPKLNQFGKDAFREVCLEYLKILNKMGKLPFQFSETGCWIGKVGTIDIVCRDTIGHTIIGLCEFEKECISYADFEWLRFCVAQAKLNGDVYYLFSRNDFDEEIKAFANNAGNVVLIDLSIL